MTTRTKIWLNVVVAIGFIGTVAYTIYLLNDLTASLIEERVAHAKFFSRLIRENWEGIKSFSDKDKNALLQSLDPTLLAFDIQMLRTVILILLYGFGASVVLGRAIAIFKLWKATRLG